MTPARNTRSQKAAFLETGNWDVEFRPLAAFFELATGLEKEPHVIRIRDNRTSDYALEYADFRAYRERRKTRRLLRETRATQRRIEQRIREEEEERQLRQNVYNLLDHLRDDEPFQYHPTPLPSPKVEKEDSPNLFWPPTPTSSQEENDPNDQFTRGHIDPRHSAICYCTHCEGRLERFADRHW